MNFLIKVTDVCGNTEYILSDIERLGRDIEVIFTFSDDVKVEVDQYGK